MHHARRRPGRILALLLPLVLVVGGCGGKKSDNASPNAEDEPAGDPVRGGSLTYGVEAETGDGWCMPEAQLAISGILVARAIYDTLTVPTADGEYVPYLAEAVEPSEDFKTWTITLRDGVKFHDGSDLDAEVVKNNLNAYRGFGKGDGHERSPALFIFVLQNIDTVEATGDLEVTVTTKVPWVAFPAFLYSSGRLGITAQAQLDDTETCDRELIGTGPFKIVSWEKDRQFVAEKNPDYWQEAPDGKPYPYLDEIRFQPIIESEQRINALENEDLGILHTSTAQDFKTLDTLAEDGAVKNRDSAENAEVTFVQINNSKEPFDDVRIRRAMALAIDRDEYNEVINLDLLDAANGPFAKGSIAYLEDTGFPSKQDLDESKRLIAEYEDEKGPLRPITYQATPGTVTQQVAVFLQQKLEAAGFEMEIETVQQDKLIDNAIGGEFDIMGFRNYPGGDPDELYVWFHSTSVVNFGRIKDPEIDAALDEGRSETDPEKRAELYQEMNREFGKELYSLWANVTTWRLGAAPDVFGFTPDTYPPLPGDDQWIEGLAAGHPIHGLWVTGE